MTYHRRGETKTPLQMRDLPRGRRPSLGLNPSISREPRGRGMSIGMLNLGERSLMGKRLATAP